MLKKQPSDDSMLSWIPLDNINESWYSIISINGLLTRIGLKGNHETLIYGEPVVILLTGSFINVFSHKNTSSVVHEPARV
ncbi:uncharacterized protein H6S33_005415 [Morchella sextelata]|uniref:uncharacterized protein n=1 Tax=Morchella sextelata TaxID=1174677 RepID=UPI001D049A91|nr:uncharacterized protein H6S33_005415 [Morchella sextelata]KAH0613529.1 hypothetical protein H6S33_005415 [Morchella sextelata]